MPGNNKHVLKERIKYNERLIGLFIVLLNTATLSATYENIAFRSYTIEHGLPENNILKIVQDSNNFIWIATENGISKFDGSSFTNYYHKPDDPGSISSNFILDLFVDSRGVLWVGTYHGLNRYYPETDKFTRYIPVPSLPPNSMRNSVYAISEAKNGDIYFQVHAGQLLKLENNVIRQVLNLKQDGCKFMVIDKKNQCWIAVSNKLYRYDIDNNLTTEFTLRFPDYVKEPEVTDMWFTDSTIWISSYRSEVIKFNYFTSKYYYFDLFPDKFQPTTSCLLPVGEYLFIGSSVYGLKAKNLKTGSVISYTEETKNSMSLSSNVITCLFVDKQGNFWVGTGDGGLNVSYKNKGFKGYSYNYNNFKRNTTVQAIYNAPDQSLWLGYGSGGFEVFDRNNKSVMFKGNIENIKPTSALSAVFEFYTNEENTMWIGTYSNGLLKYNIKTGQTIQYYPGSEPKYNIDGVDVRSITTDNQGNLWIGIHGKGLSVKLKDEEHFRTWNEFNPDLPDAVNQPWVFDLAFDKKGDLWVASNHGCYHYCFSSNTYNVYKNNASGKFKLPDDAINSIFVDSVNNIWLAGYCGIYYINRQLNKTIVISDKDGLPMNKVMALTKDNNNNIWASTRYGIARITHNDSLGFKIKSYNRYDGLNTNYFWINAVSKNDSLIYFGGKSGYTVFNPELVLKDKVPPRVTFTNLYLFDTKVEIKPGNTANGEFTLDKNLSYYNRLTINSRNNSIGFEFTALDYGNYSTHYKYKLEGFNSEWVSVNKRNIIYFTNLAPGNYTLRLKASSGDGYWGSNSTDLHLKIKPPLWKSMVAKTLYLLIFLFVMLFLRKQAFDKEKMRLQAEQQKQLKEMRTRFFMNISHELKTPLTLVYVPLKKLIEDYYNKNISPGSTDLNMIYRNINRILRIINQIFDFRKIELNKKKDVQVEFSDLIALTNSVLQYFYHQIQQKSIQLETTFESETLSLYFDPDKMDKILYNLLSNAIKYTPTNGNISISIKSGELKVDKNSITPAVVFTITDTGPGIAAGELKNIFDRFSLSNKSIDGWHGTGIGLSIVKEYTELHHGTINIESENDPLKHAGTFTRVTLSFPKSKDVYDTEQFTNYPKAASIIQDYKFINSLEQFQTNSEEHHVKGSMETFIREKYKLLVVDDETDVCDLLEAELSVNFYVEKAYDGTSALQAASEYLPDLIISDIMMPGMNGYELCKRLKLNPETSHIPIILLTARSEISDQIEAYKTGADAFVQKPFNLQLLSNRINTLIENRQLLKKSFLSSYGINLNKAVPTQTDEKFIQQFIQIINQHISEKDLNVDLITRELGISRSQLYKKIKSLANTSVNLFIRSIRLQKAAQLLAAGRMNISEVAYAVGFENLPYFSKCFQETFGETPKKYAATHCLKN